MNNQFYTANSSKELGNTTTTFIFNNRTFYLILLFALFAAAALSAKAQEKLVGLTSGYGPQSGGTAFSIKTTGTNFTIQRSFAELGYSPTGDLVRGTDGNFYGMTTDHYYGQVVTNHGTIFKMTPTGQITVLHRFDPDKDGGTPYGSLIQAKDGNFYGMTSAAGPTGWGTIFKITPGGVFTLLHSFGSSVNGYYSEGAAPRGSLVQGADGNFYGMTHEGGPTDASGYTTYGTVFKMTPDGTITVLYRFTYDYTGGQPYGSLTAGKDGNFYGMTYYGGSKPSPYDKGTIFKITPTGVLTVLYYLDFNTTGADLYGSLTLGSDGYFYGMSQYGSQNGYGAIFKISPTGVVTVLHSLVGQTEGAWPKGNLVQGKDGYFYGMTQSGGGYNKGTIFKISSTGAFAVVHSFNPPVEGANPLGSLIQSTDGNFYGMTSAGGVGNIGTVFKMTPAGALTTMVQFPTDPSGSYPYSSLVQGSDGMYYGTTSEGGVYGFGTVFKMCNGTYTVLRSLNGGSDGRYPLGALVQGIDGNYYGTTYQGGSIGYGTIYRISASGTYTVLHSFTGADGANPYGSLVQGSDSSFYGMAYAGGADSSGTIFKITPAGRYTVLRHLNATRDGSGPFGNLIRAKDGNFYGMTSIGGIYGYGTVFKMTSAGGFTKLKDFDYYNADGCQPYGSLIQGSDGYLYGLTAYGGTTGYGTAFKITTTGAYKVVHDINPGTEGKFPKGSLVRASDGNFYGLMSQGGTNNAGTIFRLTSTGVVTVLRNLNPATDGGNPLGNLVLEKANPVANAQSVSINEDIAKTIVLSGNGGSPLIYNITTAPKNGTLSGTGANVTYTPKANYYGKDSFYFATSWGCQSSAPAKVFITVAPVNDAPILTTIGNKTIAVNATLTFTATATDVDAGQTKTFSLINAPAGAIINASSGVFTWKPAATGTYTFKVRLTDNGTPTLYDEEQITVSVTQSILAGTKQAAQVQTVTPSGAGIYPNPVHDKYYVTLPAKNGKVMISVINITGSIISTNTYNASVNGRVELDASRLSRGMYLLQIETATGKQQLKFIKE